MSDLHENPVGWMEFYSCMIKLSSEIFEIDVYDIDPSIGSIDLHLEMVIER